MCPQAYVQILGRKLPFSSPQFFCLFVLFVVVVVVYLEREILSTYWVDMVINNKCYLSSQIVILTNSILSFHARRAEGPGV